MWSVSKVNKKLDRASRATSRVFEFMPHSQFVDLVTFDLEESNQCRAAGTLWVRRGCILMGGPCSAQAADLHSLWRAYQKRQLFRKLGSLIVSKAGFPYWVGKHTVAMVQFRDNILLATDAPPSEYAELVELVRGILEEAWGLHVVCDCVTDTQLTCTRACCSAVFKAMGVVMVWSECGLGMAFIEPSSVTPQWQLK